LNSDSSFSEKFTVFLTEMMNQMLGEYDYSEGEVSVVIADNALLQSLNRQYRDKDAPTDVLSFSYLEAADQIPGEEKEFAVGDIYISIERARDQAAEAGHSLRRETTLLAVHGLLHLLGFDHDDETNSGAMQKQERAALEKYDLIFAGGETDA
jgi:probable rRNA maturation factor